MTLLKLVDVASAILSLFKTEDGSKETIRTKLIILAMTGLVFVTGYVVTEYRIVYERAVDYKWQAHHLAIEVSTLETEVENLKKDLEAKDTSVTKPVPIQKSSYEHPPMPTNPAPEKRKPPEAIVRERVDNLMQKING